MKLKSHRNTPFPWQLLQMSLPFCTVYSHRKSTYVLVDFHCDFGVKPKETQTLRSATQ